eukprot:TRINITY_DN3446_c0_g2_i1.p2 TRINITY_DN3446_c0_g2~~TRINITY_DN3446_c0_g2_i1.p2  ORF type:complete len:148 (+),score=1.09 TRINITY_DN3446_c0_g2_i1:865-1308(+)
MRSQCWVKCNSGKKVSNNLSDYIINNISKRYTNNQKKLYKYQRKIIKQKIKDKIFQKNSQQSRSRLMSTVNIIKDQIVSLKLLIVNYQCQLFDGQFLRQQSYIILSTDTKLKSNLDNNTKNIARNPTKQLKSEMQAVFSKSSQKSNF